MTSFINGKVFTGFGNKFVSAFTVEHGEIVWAGDTADVNDDNIIDLNGKTVLPGLIDAHTHPKYIADALHGVACTPPNVNSIEEMKAALKNSPAFGKGPNTWIEGWGFDETKLAEHRSPNRDDLDQISTEQPIFIYRSDCHSSVGNSKALELAGIDENTPDPKGGFIEHFSDGRPTGFMREVAASQLLIQAKSAQSYETDVTNMVNSSTHYLENGIVAIGEMMGRKQPYDTLKLYEDSVAKGFKPKSSIYYVFSEIRDQQVDATEGDQLRIAGVKVFMDGSISGETAFNFDKYPSGNTGVALTTPERLAEAVAYAKQHNLQLAVHAMGDAAIQRVIDVTKDIEPWLADGIPSVRIEHASLMTDDMLNQVKDAKMNYALVTQPIFYFTEDESYRQFLNSKQFKTAYRLKSMIDSTAVTALSSDAPCTPWAEPDSPFYSIYAAVTRKAANDDIVNPEEAISVLDAVHGYTDFAAQVGSFEHNGRLLPGFDADFVILTDDIFTVPEEQIKDIRVEQTWMAGNKVYSK
ncbi:amidohydrolase [Lentilactobacillus curieae]|uniref:Amidohydrolase n=1 Tax=Lentilactobacillus curieae TaxID=1138822 RepID=A0A1S6QIT2_9LACO|nr:amidohydrolase [Lentilactobacillus curieae]AQW21511.1 amidohydrolase [Lentilactobacillus curieae]